MGVRNQNRAYNQLRQVEITTGYLPHAEGSALIKMGSTVVICAASVEEGVPKFLEGSHSGWITAEYGMLPRSTHTRTKRESATGRLKGRTMEIQRVIGRSMRAAVDMDKMGPFTIHMDCDVICADGGTRTASITGGYVALYEALRHLVNKGTIESNPVHDFVAAVSVGFVDGELLLDLEYAEDSRADVDMNIVMTGAGEIVEIQGTAERTSFSRRSLDEMIDLAAKGIGELHSIQKKVLGFSEPRKKTGA